MQKRNLAIVVNQNILFLYDIIKISLLCCIVKDETAIPSLYYFKIAPIFTLTHVTVFIHSMFMSVWILKQQSFQKLFSLSKYMMSCQIFSNFFSDDHVIIVVVFTNIEQCCYSFSGACMDMNIWDFYND